jgi:hypothetical protein
MGCSFDRVDLLNLRGKGSDSFESSDFKTNDADGAEVKAMMSKLTPFADLVGKGTGDSTEASKDPQDSPD